MWSGRNKPTRDTEGTQEDTEEGVEVAAGSSHVDVSGWVFRGCSIQAPGRHGIPNETLISCPAREE